MSFRLHRAARTIGKGLSSRSIIAIAMAAVVTLLAIPVGSRTQRELLNAELPVSGGSQTEQLKLQRLKPNLYVILEPERASNVVVRVTADGVIIVDAKFPEHTVDILKLISSVTPQPVKYLINTHHHFDHTSGNVNLKNSVEIIGHRNMRESILKGPDAPGAPRIVFNDQASVFLGGAEVQLFYLGIGHTNGDIEVYFPDLKTIALGDLYVSNMLPAIARRDGGNSAEWMKTLDNILKLDFDTVIPGHGNGPMTKPDLAAFKASFEKVRARVATLVKNREPKEQAVVQVRREDFGWPAEALASAHYGTPEFFKNLVSNIYDEIAAERK